MVLTTRTSQPQEEHFHTEGRGMERPGHNLAELLYKLPQAAKALLLSSNGQHTRAVSKEGHSNSLNKQQVPETLYTDNF